MLPVASGFPPTRSTIAYLSWQCLDRAVNLFQLHRDRRNSLGHSETWQEEMQSIWGLCICLGLLKPRCSRCSLICKNTAGKKTLMFVNLLNSIGMIKVHIWSQFSSGNVQESQRFIFSNCPTRQVYVVCFFCH